ncbi:MAG: hypothetical protein KKF41_16155 [Actinobacteria bacterium]|nr:hypothetical protein [Actinomycetota bacterium]MBU1944560.1 hypothetical protein [Actinomycetota bacterium]MBU2689113.1 hypothetical protein [Actinomycetota bacterium]
MKKFIIVGLVVALGLGALAVAGCGDTSQAKEYMEKGDELSRKMASLTDDAVFDAGALLAELGIQISETGTVDKKTLTDAASKQIDTIIANGKKAVAEYEKILDLKGVDAYKEYAEQRISAIESTIAVLEAVQELLDRIGDPQNTASIKDTVTEWAKSNIEVAVDAVKAYTSWSNAAKIKKENNLGPAEEPEKVEETTPESAPE